MSTPPAPTLIAALRDSAEDVREGWGKRSHLLHTFADRLEANAPGWVAVDTETGEVRRLVTDVQHVLHGIDGNGGTTTQLWRIEDPPPTPNGEWVSEAGGGSFLRIGRRYLRWPKFG